MGLISFLRVLFGLLHEPHTSPVQETPVMSLCSRVWWDQTGALIKERVCVAIPVWVGSIQRIRGRVSSCRGREGSRQTGNKQASEDLCMYRYFRRLQLYMCMSQGKKSPRICYQRAGRVVQAAAMVGYRDIFVFAGVTHCSRTLDRLVLSV